MKGKYRVMLLQILVLIMTVVAGTYIALTVYKDSYRQESIQAFEICKNSSLNHINNIYWDENRVCYNCTNPINNRNRLICR